MRVPFIRKNVSNNAIGILKNKNRKLCMVEHSSKIQYNSLIGQIKIFEGQQGGKKFKILEKM